MKKRIKLLVLLTIVTQVIYLIFRIGYTLPWKFGLLSMVLGSLLLLAEFSSNAQGMYEFLTLSKRKKTSAVSLMDKQYPDVDILITTHNESRELLYKTLNACKNLTYPDSKKIHIYLCDDSLRSEMQALANLFNVHYVGMKKEDNPDKKAGNVNNALKHSSSPLVACLDCDMIPKSNFLMEVVPYFYETENRTKEEIAVYCQTLEENGFAYKIAYVQTPQDFYTLDLFQYNLFADNILPNEQDYFFKHVNESRIRYNSAIYCGSNAIISRQALEATGGLSTDSITEDFSSSIKLQKAGYEGRAISTSYVYGLCPFTIEDLKDQRIRWSRGFIQGIRSNKLFRSKLSLMSKLSYLVLYNYWMLPFRKLIFLFVPVLSVLFKLHIVQTDIYSFFIFWLPSYLFYNFALSLVSEKSLNRTYSNLIDTILTPYIAWPLFKEMIGIKEHHFVVTPKEMDRINEAPPLRYVIFNVIGIAATVAALIWTMFNSRQLVFASQIFVAFWLTGNLGAFIYALSFNRPRSGLNQEFIRWNLALKGKLYLGKQLFEVETNYLNEQWISLKLANDLAEMLERTGRLEIENAKYPAAIKIRVSAITNSQIILKVAEEIDVVNSAYNQYLHLLHDRKTTYVTKIVNGNFWLENFDKNFLNAFKFYKVSRLNNKKLSLKALNFLLSRPKLLKKK